MDAVTNKVCAPAFKLARTVRVSICGVAGAGVKETIPALLMFANDGALIKAKSAPRLAVTLASAARLLTKAAADIGTAHAVTPLTACSVSAKLKLRMPIALANVLGAAAYLSTYTPGAGANACQDPLS